MERITEKPIVGWRLWKLRYNPEPMGINWILTSPYMKAIIWAPHKKLVGYERKDSYTCLAMREGIHAWKTLGGLLRSSEQDTIKEKGTVIGEVWLWGIIQQCEGGYRAEFAYPKSLCLVDSARKLESENLARTYRAEMFDIDALDKETLELELWYDRCLQIQTS